MHVRDIMTRINHAAQPFGTFTFRSPGEVDEIVNEMSIDRKKRSTAGFNRALPPEL